MCKNAGPNSATPWSGRLVLLVGASGWSGRGEGVSFCETEDDLGKVNEYMNSLSPPRGSGVRSSVEMFEVVLDSDQL